MTTEITLQYQILIKQLQAVKKELQEEEFFGDTHEDYFEEMRFLGRLMRHVGDIQEVARSYLECA